MRKRPPPRSLNQTKASEFVRKGGLRVTMNAILQRNSDVTAEELAEALLAKPVISLSLQKAIVGALLNTDGEFRIEVKRTRRGRPETAISMLTIAEQTAKFVSQQEARGAIHKVAISEACITLGISRATAYARIGLWRKIEASRQKAAVHIPGDMRTSRKPKKVKAPEVATTTAGSADMLRTSSTTSSSFSSVRELERHRRSRKLKRNLDHRLFRPPD